MTIRITQLQYRELVDISDGTRYGPIGDLEIDAERGTIKSVIVCGRGRVFGLLGREADLSFPWSCVRRIGADIILVEGPGGRVSRSRDGSAGNP